MATTETNFVLVEMIPDQLTSKPVIGRVVRAYLSQRRAEEDCDLLTETFPDTSYCVLSVPYIDN